MPMFAITVETARKRFQQEHDPSYKQVLSVRMDDCGLVLGKHGGRLGNGVVDTPYSLG